MADYVLGYKKLGVNIKMRGKTVMHAFDSAVVVEGHHKAERGVDAYQILILPRSPLETPETAPHPRGTPTLVRWDSLHWYVLLVRTGDVGIELSRTLLRVSRNLRATLLNWHTLFNVSLNFLSRIPFSTITNSTRDQRITREPKQVSYQCQAVC